MAGLKGLAAKLFSRESIAKEFDPETEEPIDDGDSQNGGHGSGSEESSEDDTKDTEHYVQVGKSKLRQKQPLALGPEYRGVRVSRAQIEQESEDDEEEEEDDDDDDDEEEEEFDDPDDVDPEADDVVDSEDEIDSDDAFGSDDEALKRKFTFRGSSKPRVGKKHVESEDEEDDEAEEDDEDDEGDSEDGSEDGSEEDEEGDNDDNDDTDESEEDDEEDEATAKALEEARKILAQDQQRVVSSLSQSAKADADKGFAVRQQRRAFDALLNVRIRMQKALVSANSLDAASTEDESATVDDSVANDAEAKTIKLLNTISSIRQSFYGNGGEDGGSATKRKRGEDDDDDDSVDTSVTCEALFDRMVQAEEAAVAKRRKVLDRWSQRVQRPGASGAMSRRSGSSTGLQTLVDLLESQLATPDRLIRRTQTPRSCAPVQVAKRVPEDPEIYDDADFYQLLLKELVDQRAADATAPGGSGAPTVRWATTAVKEAKTRKLVDRRASKGRKMRFNVHEKLQNFMAPEDRRTWEPEAIDRLFSTLFGQRIELREDDDANNDDDQDEGGALLEEESLRLFRN